MAAPPANDLIDTQAVDHSETHGAEVVDQVLLIPTEAIDPGERLRPVDPVWAEALGRVILREGQRTPIEVCRLPGSIRWTLVAGAHRLAGARMLGIAQLRGVVVSANRDDRRLREVSENLWRKGLDPIDRAAFIAEAVAILKRRAGIDPNKDGRSASATARWTRAVAAEADDATATIAVAYGWSEEIGRQVGLSARTIRDDLTLYRRLAPSLVARLREARHPVARNASQLRALARLDEDAQGRAVVLLLSGRARTAGDAVKMLRAEPQRTPEDRRLSTILGTLERMSAGERLGLVQHPAFHALLPAEARRLLAPMLRDGSDAEAQS